MLRPHKLAPHLEVQCLVHIPMEIREYQGL